MLIYIRTTIFSACSFDLFIGASAKCVAPMWIIKISIMKFNHIGNYFTHVVFCLQKGCDNMRHVDNVMMDITYKYISINNINEGDIS